MGQYHKRAAVSIPWEDLLQDSQERSRHLYRYMYRLVSETKA